MKNYVVLLCCILFPFAVSAIGISDWTEKTPCGNEINNFGRKTLYLKNNQQVDDLLKWYFYKDYVVGIILDPIDKDLKTSYFIVNEKTYDILRFDSKTEWQQSLRANNLIPKLWTRWYQTDWIFFSDNFYFLIPVIVLILFLVYKAVRKKRFKLFKPYTTISAVMFLFMVFYWLLDCFPQSF